MFDSKYEPLFSDKYKPQSLNDMIIDDRVKQYLRGWIEKGTIQNILLSGRPGIGKTLLSRIIGKELNANVKFLSCAINGDVDTMRNEVTTFCSKVSLDGPKIIILDEAEQLSKNSGSGSSAQNALKNIMDAASDDTRFIATLNTDTLVIDALHSRFKRINVVYSKQDIAKRCRDILVNEGITFKSTDTDNRAKFKLFCDEVIGKQFPDIRKILECLESWSFSGTLVEDYTVSSVRSREYNELLKYTLANLGDCMALRQYLVDNESKFNGDYIKLTMDMFENVGKDMMGVIGTHFATMSNTMSIHITFATMLYDLEMVEHGA